MTLCFLTRSSGFVALTLCCLLAACGGPPYFEHERPAGAAVEFTRFEEQLAGTKWLLTHWADGEEVYEEAHVTLEVAGNHISGQAACNQYHVGFREPEEGELIVEGNVTATKKLCPDPLMYVEDRYFDILPALRSYRLEGNTLYLEYATPEGSEYLLFTEIPPDWRGD